jgi:hypothetical protein
MKQYKVLTTLKDFSGKFDPEKIEQTLNANAKEGWRVVSSAAGDFYFGGTSKNEYVVILEKDE